MSATDVPIVVNVDTIWLVTNLLPDEKQFFVFHGQEKLRLVTVFDEIGMSEKTWVPYAGNSNVIEGVYSWEITDDFKALVAVYSNNINRMNITLNVEDKTLALDSHGLQEHGFRWKESNIEIDGETTWDVGDRTVEAECQFDWRDLKLVLTAAQHCTFATIKVNSESNDILWEGFNDEGTKCWAHQNQRLAWKFGSSQTKFQPAVLYRLLQTLDRPNHYGTNTKVSILKSKLLMIESDNTLAYMCPVLDDAQISDGLENSTLAPEVN